MNRSTLLRLGLLLSCLCAVAPAHAQLTIDRSVLEFSPAQKTQDLELYNGGDFKLYLNLGIAEVVDPHLPGAARVELDDPRTAPMLVSPEQVLLQPGQRKRVRVIMREAVTDSDRIFRLSVKPYAGKVDLGPTTAGEKSTGVKVLVGYEILLISRPEALAPQLEVERSDSSLAFTNTGNTNVLLRRVKQCEKDGSDCVELRPNRLYVGERAEFDLPKKGAAEDYPVEVLQVVGLRNSRSTY